MRVVELFSSLIGEGTNTGRPAIFLRLAFCNLNCKWCDQKDARSVKAGKERTSEEIIEEILRYNVNHLVITGGEPLVQTRQIMDLLYKLKRQNKDMFIEIETNGTIMPEYSLRTLVHQWDVSPKLSNSGNAEIQETTFEAYNSFSGFNNAYFKFVIKNQTDIQEALDLCELFNIPRDRVMFMPECRTKRGLSNRLPWLAKMCIRYDIMLSNRLQVQIWGQKRGV